MAQLTAKGYSDMTEFRLHSIIYNEKGKLGANKIGHGSSSGTCSEYKNQMSMCVHRGDGGGGKQRLRIFGLYLL